MRFTTGQIPIRPDERWRTAMPTGQRRTVTALTMPLLAHYGYARAGRMTDWPSVGVVVPTWNRPAQLRVALAAVLAQDYPGQLRAIVVMTAATLIRAWPTAAGSG